MKRNYYGYMYTIAYLMLLRIILHITVGISVFNFGILFDLILMMFWVGAIAYLIRSNKWRKAFYIFVIVVSTAFAIGDSIYFDYFGIISARSSFAGLTLLTSGQTLEEYHIQIPLIGWLTAPVLIFTSYLIISNKKRDKFVFKDFGILSLVFVVQVALFLYWGSYDFETKIDYYRSDAYLFETMHNRVDFSEKYGYYNYHILDFTRIRKKTTYEADVEIINEYFDKQTAHQPNDMSDMYDGYNVVTILAESLDTRFIHPDLTPNLYMMKENGYTFDNYFVPVFQQGATCNSEFMSFTGLYSITTNDFSSNVCDNYSENSYQYALPNQLKEDGYETYYFHSGYEWFYNRNNMIPSYGFETVKFQEDIYDMVEAETDLVCEFNEDMEACKEYFQERYDRDMMQFMDEYVDYSNPFYINLLTYSGHGAYNQTDFDKYLPIIEEVYDIDDYEYDLINYYEKMIELDHLIGDMITELDNQGVLDNTLIVVYPDHYPYMLDHDIYEEFINIEITDKEVHRQDLIMYNPNMTPQTISTPGSTVDITPTILNMVNSDGEFKYFMGTDLFSTDENYVIFSDLTITDGVTFLDINEQVIGDTYNKELFDMMLEEEIEALDTVKLILKRDYFKE